MGKNVEIRMLYPNKLSSKYEDMIKVLSGTEDLKNVTQSQPHNGKQFGMNYLNKGKDISRRWQID